MERKRKRKGRERENACMFMSMFVCIWDERILPPEVNARKEVNEVKPKALGVK